MRLPGSVIPNAAREYSPTTHLSFLCTRPASLPLPGPSLSRLHAPGDYFPTRPDVEPRKPIRVRDWATLKASVGRAISSRAPLGIKQMGQNCPNPKGPSDCKQFLARMTAHDNPGQRLTDNTWASCKTIRGRDLLKLLVPMGSQRNV